MEHFGVKLTSKGKGFKLTRDEFALIDTKPSLRFMQSLADRNAYSDEFGTSYRKEWCEEYREICLKNYDLNMQYFSMLDEEKFNRSLESFLGQYEGFQEVFDLKEYAQVEGYYIMVFDEYKQVYIGKTDNIKKRIMQHWSKSKQFDRTLLPMYDYKRSCFSVDFFRALDTTRIYAWKKRVSTGVEDELIRNFPKRFCTNRIGGDITSAIQALGTINKRDF